MTAPIIATKSKHGEIHGIDAATGYLIDVDGAFLGVPQSVTAAAHNVFVTAATAAAKLLRARPVAGTSTVWSASHQRLFETMDIDLEMLRGHVHHDATRWLTDAMKQVHVERRLRENGLPLPARNAIYIQALAGEIRLAQRTVDGYRAALAA